MPIRPFFTLVFCCFLAILCLPGLAAAQDGSSGWSFDLQDFFQTVGPWLLIALAASELARRVAAVVPGKRDDEIVGIIDGILRKLIDFVGGVPTKPSDPGLVLKEDDDDFDVVEVEDDDDEPVA